VTTATARRRPTPPLPGIACEIRDETWGPHPGCAEFMTAPEVWICRTPATHHARPADAECAAWYGGSPTRTIKVRLCAAHAARADEYGLARVYRTRRI
jgi:hypothetical protein